MKFLSILCLSLFIQLSIAHAAGSSGSNTSSRPKPHIAIGVDASSISYGELNLQFDIVLNDSFTLGPQYISMSDTEAYEVSDRFNTTISSKGFALNANWHLGGTTRSSSWYARPYLKYLSVNVQNTLGTKASASAIGAGGLIGYQWVTKNSFRIKVGLGAQQLELNLSKLMPETNEKGAKTVYPIFDGELDGIIEASIGYLF